MAWQIVVDIVLVEPRRAGDILKARLLELMAPGKPQYLLVCHVRDGQCPNGKTRLPSKMMEAKRAQARVSRTK